MASTLNLGPIITAMVTPFDKSGNVDYAGIIHLADYLLENNTSCFLLTGTTGESPTLTHKEEFKLYETFVQRYKGKVPIMAGTGSNSTKTAIESTKKASQIGIDCSLQVVPYYNRPSQDGLLAHFSAIADQSSIPIMLYDIPARTGCALEINTVIELAKHPNIIGIKDATGSVENFKLYQDHISSDFLVYSGDDALIVEFMKFGAKGAVSVASHVAGKQILELINALLISDKPKIKLLEERLNPLFEVLFLTSNPAPVKYALKLLGFSMGSLRLPLVDLTPSEAAKVESVLDRYLETC